MKPRNLLFIFSDEHTRAITGCYGNPIVRTPHLDALADRGTLFEQAYTPSPLCMPARACLATGTHVFENGCWCNAFPYFGTPRSWGHDLVEAGHDVASIGKLHFRGEEDFNGFSEEIQPLHAPSGQGDLRGLIRRPPATRGQARAMAEKAGRGTSGYALYDQKTADLACEWLEAHREPGDKPWVLFLGFCQPHFPLIAEPEFYDLYDGADIPFPFAYDPAERPRHPVLETLARYVNYDDYFDEERIRTALTAYYGMVTSLDRRIGQVVDRLDRLGLSDTTDVIYTSDHGDNLGNRGFWGKSLMYEESVAVPMIMAGPDLPANRRISTPVSLIDICPTVLEGVMGLAPDHSRVTSLPGASLHAIANGAQPERPVISEYHAFGAINSYYMLRHGRFKYVHYVGHPPQLFDLDADPRELNDLAANPAYGDVLREAEARLRAILDPEEIEARSFADQEAKIAANGGAEAILAIPEYSHSPAPGEEVPASANQAEGSL